MCLALPPPCFLKCLSVVHIDDGCICFKARDVVDVWLVSFGVRELVAVIFLGLCGWEYHSVVMFLL